jgi:uncharacterized membrane protein
MTYRAGRLSTRPDLLCIAGLGAAGVVSAALSLHPMLRFALGVPLVLFVPGYALAALFVPNRVGRVPEQVLMSAGLSLATVAVLGVLLNALGAGLSRETWGVALGVITIVAAIGAGMRKPVSGSARVSRVWKPDRVGLYRAGLLTLAGLVVIVGMAVATGAAFSRTETNVTQLWIRTTGRAMEIEVGVANWQPGTTTYRLQIVDGSRLIKDWPSVPLHSEETWSSTAMVGDDGRARSVTALLYREGEDVPMRRVLVWVPGI